ncbi:hypothetical protein ACFL35_16290 [Candidatus Riflebacteria bacterium]
MNLKITTLFGFIFFVIISPAKSYRMKYNPPEILIFKVELLKELEPPLTPGNYAAKIFVKSLLTELKIQQIFLEATSDVQIASSVKTTDFVLKKGQSKEYEIKFTIKNPRAEFSYLKVNLEFWPPFNEILRKVEKSKTRYPSYHLRKELIRELKRFKRKSGKKTQFKSRIIDLN